MLEIFYKVLDFLDTYYKAIIVLLCFVAFLVSIFKKDGNAKKFLQVFNAVIEAEKTFPEPGQGAVKLAYVINKCSNLRRNYVETTAEVILSSPQKK